MKQVLVVAAHPDDEVLGCGGVMARHSDEGANVQVVFMSDGVTSRDPKAGTEKRNSAACEACGILGARACHFLGYPDNRMDDIAVLDIVQKLEQLIDQIKPSLIYTHHAGDLNVDHRITNQAVFTACRPLPGSTVREIYSFEVPSSTGWSPQSQENVFVPNCFVDVSSQKERKMAALREYVEEMKDFPHSRSFESVEAQMIYRGAAVGLTAAECFRVERLIVK